MHGAIEGRRRVVVYIEDNGANLAFMADLLTDFDRVDLLTMSCSGVGLLPCAEGAPSLEPGRRVAPNG